MTNELVVAYTEVLFPNVFSDPSAVDRGNVGYNIAGLFKNGVSQIPSFGSFGNEAALVFNPGGFEAGGASQGLYANKYMPSISDTVTKVMGTHTIKGGFFWEWIRNAQPANNNTNGELQFNSSSIATSLGYTTGDSYADEALGIMSDYNEASFNRINDIAYNQYEFFVQDDWKVTKRLTVNYGIRFSHMQPWYDRLRVLATRSSTRRPIRPAVAKLVPVDRPTADSSGIPRTAPFHWRASRRGHCSTSRAWVPPMTCLATARPYCAEDGAAITSTRVSLRTDWMRLRGSSQTSFDGGKVPVGAGSQPILVNPLPQFPGVPGIDTVNFSAVASSPSAVDSTDDKQAYTDNWNFTISRQLPWSSILEVSYIGNRSEDIPSSGNGGSAGFNTLNINLVPVGAMLASANGGVDPATLNSQNFRPLLGYGDLYEATNNAHANYNALQVVWARTKGRYTINLNYTFSKAMGIENCNGNLCDQFNVNNNYGVQSNNRPQLFNAVYSVQLPNPTTNKLLGGFVNGWQVSGVLQLESGPNLTGFQNQNFGMNYNNAIIPGSISALNPKGIAISNVSLLGTPNIQLNPIMTCSPTSNLGPHQWINGNCFAAPTQVGQNGNTVLPPIYGPAFFSWDMGLFKNFAITEHKSLQFRVNGYNWLNHPLWSFNGNNLNLSYTQNAAGDLTQSNSTFGTAVNKQGHRIVELAVKFYF